MKNVFRSKAIKGIVSARQSLVVRLTLLVYLCILLLVIAGAWLIHYPEIVKANVTMMEVYNDSARAEIRVSAGDFRKLSTGQEIQFHVHRFNSIQQTIIRGTILKLNREEQTGIFTGTIVLAKDISVPGTILHAREQTEAVIFISNLRALQKFLKWT